MLDLSVVIVNYNVKHYLEQCLMSVFRAGRDVKMEVFVVDNNSSDGSIDYLKPRFPDVHFIENHENKGFSRANNQAIRISKGRYILLLNPDTIVTEDTFTDCIKFLDVHPDVGATGVAMYNCSGIFAWESRRGLPTPFTSFCKMTGLGSLFPHSRTFGKYYMRYLDRNQPNEIEVISGAFNMLRRETLDRIGLLDEDFFMYGEDIDLSYRVLQGGWKNYYLPTPILHYKGESTQKSSYKYVHTFYNAMLIFFDKHYQKRYCLLGVFIRLAVYLRAFLDIVMHVWRKFIRLFPESKDLPPKCICHGSDEVKEELCQLCAESGLEYVESPEAEDIEYIIYDVDSFSYRDIIDKMIAMNGEYMIGTYSSKTKTLVLPYDIYTLKSDE